MIFSFLPPPDFSFKLGLNEVEALVSNFNGYYSSLSKSSRGFFAYCDLYFYLPMLLGSLIKFLVDGGFNA